MGKHVVQADRRDALVDLVTLAVTSRTVRIAEIPRPRPGSPPTVTTPWPSSSTPPA